MQTIEVVVLNLVQNEIRAAEKGYQEATRIFNQEIVLGKLRWAVENPVR